MEQVMSESTLVMKPLVAEYVDPILAAAGFRKRGMVWNRKCSGVVHVLDIQLSQWNTAEEVSFTINLGVWIEAVWRACYDKSPPAWITPTKCWPALRIGQLLDGKDKWWSVNSSRATAAVGAELRDVVANTCLPFLDRLDSCAAVLAAAEEDPRLRRHAQERLYHAILKHLVGLRDEARTALNDLVAETRNAAWREWMLDVAERLASSA